MSTLSYGGTLAAGDVLVINTEDQTATLNGANVLKDITGDWFYLAPGNNEIEYQDSEASRTVTMQIKYTPRDV